MVVAPLTVVPSTGSSKLNHPFVVGYSAFQSGISVLRDTRPEAIHACILAVLDANIDRIEAELAQEPVGTEEAQGPEDVRLHATCVCHTDA